MVGSSPATMGGVELAKYPGRARRNPGTSTKDEDGRGVWVKTRFALLPGHAKAKQKACKGSPQSA